MALVRKHRTNFDCAHENIDNYENNNLLIVINLNFAARKLLRK